jgi:hypothetical protein
MGEEDRRDTRARILDLDRMAGVHTALLGEASRTPVVGA